MYGKGKVEILRERTFKEFNIDVDSLKEGSHHKIYVKCTRCGEEFTRGYYLLHQLHNCPCYKTRDDGIVLKWCNHCEHFLPKTQFAANSARYDGLSSWCMTCQRGSPSAIRHNHKNAALRHTNFDYWLKHYLKQKRSHCRKENIKFNLDFQSLKTLWDKQNGRCYYFNAILTFASKKLDSASLDRIKPNNGYVIGNVVWASRAANFTKNDSNMKDFIEFLRIIDISSCASVRLECKLINPEAVIPYKKRSTDVGYDITSIESIIIPPGKMRDIHTGLIITCPKGYYLTVEPRSSLWIKGVTPFHGIIDATYTGELMTALINHSKKPFEVQKGDRIAQFILHKCVPLDIITVNEISPDYNERGTAGFGESGR